ncbi:MAG: xanthine dehydrogenase molybdenum-binding subunit XdhA [Oscillospiraceae bacterium]
MGIGKSIQRMDARQKATGTAKYVEDLLPVGALYAKVLHSTIANGLVKAIHVEEALASAGVEDVITCFDVPDQLYTTAGHPRSLDPAHQDIRDKQLLSRRVRYYGDDVAAVVARDPLSAQKALEKIVVEYEEYPPILTPADAMNSTRPLHESCPSNELARLDFTIEDGSVQWKTAHFVAEGSIAGRADLTGVTFHTPAVHACHLETNCCFAYMEERKLVIVTCNQVPHTLRRNVAEALELPLGDVRVIKPFLGGGFGNKQDTLYEPLAGFLSRRLGGRCVAVLLSREECFVNSRTRHAFDLTTVLTADETGRLQTNAMRIHANGGAYGAHGHAVAAYAVTNCFQTYVAAGEQIGESSTTYTSLPSAAALRGYGIPQLSFAVESRMDDLAREHGWDPIEFRLKNMMPRDFCDPFDHFTIQSYGLTACIEKGREASHWDVRRKEYDAFNQTSPQLKKGLGMAIFSYKTGVYPLQIENAACRILLNEDGTAQIQVGATELGQGSDTALAQIASEILTIPESRLTVISTQDTDVTPHDCGAYASRQTYISGGAVKKTALLLREKLLAKAAILSGLPVESLRLEGETVTDGKTVLSIARIAQYTQYVNDLVTDTEQLTAEATYTAHSTAFAFGASFADIEVDVPLGRIRIKKMIAVHDSGTIINPQLAAGQIHGGIAMGVGYALGEQLLFDPAGKMRNNNLLDYKMPTAMDIPEIETYFIETNDPTGPFGNKALAEPPLIPQAPAIRNAVLHATGVPIYSLPMNPQRMVHAFLEAGLIEQD